MTNYKPIPPLSPIQQHQFWEHVAVDMYDATACWPWKGRVNGEGYAPVRFGLIDLYAHRVAYTLTRGPIPDGLTIDHTCRNRRCMNPAHMEPVSASENSKRRVASVTGPSKYKLRKRTAERFARRRARGLCVQCNTQSEMYRRVFPRKTKATPDDALAALRAARPVRRSRRGARLGDVHVRQAAIAERLAEQWRHVAPVKVGGVAYGDDSLEFIPGRYIKPGYTITSRGCPRRCWFCGVWKKWPRPNVLPIYDGWNVLDDNLLAVRAARRGGVRDAAPAAARRVHGRPRGAGAARLPGRSAREPQAAAECSSPTTPGDEFETLESARAPARGRLHARVASAAVLRA
jgi:hypothetical protein